MGALCSCRLESTLVAHGVEVGPHLSAEFFHLEEPEVVTHESDLIGALSTSLLVKEITTANEWLGLPPVGIHTVDGGCALLPVDCYALVQTLLVEAKPVVCHAQVLVTALDDFDSVAIDLFDGADSSVGLIELVEEGPSSAGSPVHFATQVVLGHHVLVRLKPERIHFYLLIISNPT